MTVSGSRDIYTVEGVVVASLPPITATGTFTPQGLSIAGKITLVTLDNTQWWPLPAVPQTLRNSVAIQNTSASQILIGFDPLGLLSVGWLVYANGEFSIDVTNNIPIYATALSVGSFTVTVMELS